MSASNSLLHTAVAFEKPSLIANTSNSIRSSLPRTRRSGTATVSRKRTGSRAAGPNLKLLLMRVRCGALGSGSGCLPPGKLEPSLTLPAIYSRLDDKAELVATTVNLASKFCQLLSGQGLRGCFMGSSLHLGVSTHHQDDAASFRAVQNNRLQWILSTTTKPTLKPRNMPMMCAHEQLHTGRCKYSSSVEANSRLPAA